MTLLNFQDLSPVKKAVEVEIPAELIASVADRVAGEFSRQAKLPGFRPGKIPAKVVRNKFAKEIQEEVMSRVLPLTFQQAMAEKGLTPVGDPHLEHLDAYVEGAPLKYKAEFEVKPTIELGEYRGLEIEDPKIEVAEADVEAMVERLRDQASVYREESARPIADGDYAMIEIASHAEGMETNNDTGHVRLGEDSPLPELHEALRGKNLGDTVSFEKTYGEDAKNEAFRGKNIRHEVTLKEIRVQEKPEVSDEFAKSVGGWEGVSQMREAIAADIRKHRQAEVQRLKRNQIGDRLLERHSFDVPDTLVEDELGRSLQNYARFLASQGVDLEKAEMDWKRIGEDFRPEAIKRVKRSLILEEISKKENLVVSDVEVDAEIRKAASDGNRDFAEVRHRLKHDGAYEELRSSLSQDKALEFVLGESKPKA